MFQMHGKKALVVGVANENSIAWGCAKAFKALGADLAITYLNDKAEQAVRPLAQELEAEIVLPLDVRDTDQMDALFHEIAQRWGQLDTL